MNQFSSPKDKISSEKILENKIMSKQALEQLVHNDILFYSIGDDSYAPRNPLFWHCWREKYSAKANKKSY